MCKIYNANDCYFAIQEGNEFTPNTAVIVPIEFWDENHFWDDSIGGHNVNNTDLINGGCCDVEMMEGIFECSDDDMSLVDFNFNMMESGFIKNDELITYFL